MTSWHGLANCAYRTPLQVPLRNPPLGLGLPPLLQVHRWATTKGWAWALRPHRLGSTSRHNRLACSHHPHKAARAARLRLFPPIRTSSHRSYRPRQASLGSYLRVLRLRRHSWARSLRVFHSPPHLHHNLLDISRLWHHSLQGFNRPLRRDLPDFNRHWRRSLPDFNRRWRRSLPDSNHRWRRSLLDINRLLHSSPLGSNHLWHHSRLAFSRRSRRSLRAMARGRRSGVAVCHQFRLSPRHSRMARLGSCNPVSPSLHYYTSPHFLSTISIFFHIMLNSFLAEPTGFNPGFGQSQFGNGLAPQSSSGPAQKDTNPVNVFASMKAGTFANDSAPQSAGEAFLRAVGGRAS